jgi:hypothetical protein
LKGGQLSQLKKLAPCVNNRDSYRASAEACLKLAAVIDDPHAKLVLANMAEAWLRLADYVEQWSRTEAGEDIGADNSHGRDAKSK